MKLYQLALDVIVGPEIYRESNAALVAVLVLVVLWITIRLLRND